MEDCSEKVTAEGVVRALYGLVFYVGFLTICIGTVLGLYYFADAAQACRF